MKKRDKAIELLQNFGRQGIKSQAVSEMLFKIQSGSI
jgi:hypothetical protein